MGAGQIGVTTSPLVSIIIPVYNDTEFIKSCLDSILAQTVPFWEVWMTVDCSSDYSLEIIRDYCDKDPRFHYMCNSTNSSAWVCRAKGILAASASVKYIMFADADDSLTNDAVERAYRQMEKDPVDILHFGTNVINCAQISGKRIKSYNEYLSPVKGKLIGKEIFDSFVNRNFEGHLWNKMFNADLLRDVIREWGADRILPKAQDKVLYWAVCWHKEDLTYRGVTDKLYNYSYGLGVEGNAETLELDKFKQYLCQAWTEDAISNIMAKHPGASKAYAEILEQSRYNLVRHSIRNFLRLPLLSQPEALSLVAEYWNKPQDKARITCALAEYTWEEQMVASDLFSKAELYKTTKKSDDIHVIGTYYHRMDNGGIQRVIAQLVSYWHDMGYKIVLFTDCEPTENDYELPDYVERVTIARSFSKCNKDNYCERGMSLSQLLEENNVDCMVYHSYFSDVLLYDMNICKVNNIPFMIYVHNVFTKYLRYNDRRFSTLPIFCRSADAVLALDETSCRWWKCFNPNTHYVTNPLTFDLSLVSASERNNRNILFLCRLDEDAKHPKDAIEIIGRLAHKIPEIKLYIVGDGEKEYVDELYELIRNRKLENNIVMCGFDKDVEKYYKMCSIFLSCSSYEGFMLTLCEAMSYNLPIVMYDLPYLPTVINNPGIIAVQQRNIEAASDALFDLLSAPEELRETGDSGRAFLDAMYSVDIKEQWKNVFASLDIEIPIENDPDSLMLNTIVYDYYDGVSNVAKMARELRRKRRELNDIRRSLSFKLGRIITFIPRKLRDLIKNN